MWFEAANRFQALDLWGFRGQERGAEYERGSKLAEMRFPRPKVQHVQGRLASNFSLGRDRDGGSSGGTSALIWGWTSGKKKKKKNKKGSTCGWRDLSTRSGTDRRPPIITSPQGNERTGSILLLSSGFCCPLTVRVPFYSPKTAACFQANTHFYSFCVHR